MIARTGVRIKPASAAAMHSRSNLIGRTLASERGISLVVVIMVMVIILAMTAAGLLFSSMDLRITSNFRAGTQAFYAADNGVSVGVSQLALDQTVSTAPFGPLALPGGLTYCSGTRNLTNGCAAPQPSQLYGIRSEPGYLLGTNGYSFYQYQINVTGTGPLAAAREVEAQAEYGPVPK